MATLSLRVHVRQLRVLVWAGTVALSGAALWNAWQMIRKIRAKAYDPRSSTYFEQVIGSAAGSIPASEVKPAAWADYEQALVRCPINGYEAKKPEPVLEEPKPEVLPEKPLSDVISVTAITCAPDDNGRVAVKYKDETAKPVSRDEVVLKIGASLAYPYDGPPYNSRLKAIRSDSAIFEWCGREVETHPPRADDEDRKVAKGASAATRKPFDSSLTSEERRKLEENKSQEKTIAYAPDSYVVGTKDYDAVSANPEDYLKELRITEQRDANNRKEVAVGPLRPNSVFVRNYGVQTGDVLVSINGEPVTSKAQAIEYVKAHDDLSKYVVVIRRKGREITKTYLVNRDRK
jgi:hypothetical protein